MCFFFFFSCSFFFSFKKVSLYCFFPVCWELVQKTGRSGQGVARCIEYMLRFVEAPFRLLGCLEIVPEWIYSSIRIPNTETVIEGVDFSPKREILTSTGTMSADRWLGLRAPLRSSRWRMRYTRLYPGTCPARPSRLF